MNSLITRYGVIGVSADVSLACHFASHAVRFAQHGAAPRPLPVADSPNQVVIDNFEFGPAEITVAPGTEVTWIHRDDEPHTVTSAADKPLFPSPALDTNEKFAFVSAWKWAGLGQDPILHKEALTFDYVHLTQRSYK